MEWSYKNRYDVTLLVNWLPLVAIELKRRWLELKEAFNQIGRYHKHSFWTGYGLFQYIQIFVISNWVNTKFLANNRKQTFKQTFYWAHENNDIISKLEDFTKVFLEPCHLSKMITKYIVLNETEKILMVLRPYQYYACENIVARVKNTSKNWYIWHTTGSWKTLTSFKVSQILTSLPYVDKVVFVVDRKDLDFQTTKEFNSFSQGSIDGTDNTASLVKQFGDSNTPLIVTTIQKLNTAISKEKHTKLMDEVSDKKIVFIFDECHRSQFGETHDKIKKFFTNHQMIWFTWTPIFAENNNNNKTTKDLFDECLHKYVITDAIKDENVLKFSIEYINTFKTKSDFEFSADEKVEDINTREVYEAPERLEKVVDYILNIHNTKTHNRDFTWLFCVSSVDTLIKYYEIFKKKNKNLNIATIFSYGVNEDDKDANGMYDEVDFEVKTVNMHSRNALESFIWDYNKTFHTAYTTKDSKEFYNYYNDIAKRVKAREIDILLVVNMFLTGFDSKTLNTLYVDKKLKYHWLIQAFSRTNRILDDRKSGWNIVCFRNLKSQVDEAIALFSNKEANEIILMEPLEKYVEYFNKALKDLKDWVPNVWDVDSLESEQEQFDFVKSFRELLRLKNILESFSDFKFDTLNIEKQEFEDYKSKYLDIYDRVKKTTAKEKVSILENVDFELELIGRDDITIDYILSLLAKLGKKENNWDYEKRKKAILDMVSWEVSLRSKKELIEKFIEENMVNISEDDITSEFEKFLLEEKLSEFEKICTEEWLDKEKFEKILKSYIYTEKLPLREELLSTLKTSPDFFQIIPVYDRLKQKLIDFVEKFGE